MTELVFVINYNCLFSKKMFSILYCDVRRKPNTIQRPKMKGIMLNVPVEFYCSSWCFFNKDCWQSQSPSAPWTLMLMLMLIILLTLICQVFFLQRMCCWILLYATDDSVKTCVPLVLFYLQNSCCLRSGRLLGCHCRWYRICFFPMKTNKRPHI